MDVNDEDIPVSGTTTVAVRAILKDHSLLPTDVDKLANNADLFQAGMTSHASVNLMLALEDAFDIEFPDHLLKRATFESIDSIRAAVDELQQEIAA